MLCQLSYTSAAFSILPRFLLHNVLILNCLKIFKKADTTRIEPIAFSVSARRSTKWATCPLILGLKKLIQQTFCGHGKTRTSNLSVNNRLLYHWATHPFRFFTLIWVTDGNRTRINKSHILVGKPIRRSHSCLERIWTSNPRRIRAVRYQLRHKTSWYRISDFKGFKCEKRLLKFEILWNLKFFVACIGLEPISQGYEPRVLPLYELALFFFQSAGDFSRLFTTCQATEVACTFDRAEGAIRTLVCGFAVRRMNQLCDIGMISMISMISTSARF